MAEAKWYPSQLCRYSLRLCPPDKFGLDEEQFRLQDTKQNQKESNQQLLAKNEPHLAQAVPSNEASPLVVSLFVLPTAQCPRFSTELSKPSPRRGA
jgi:hypothetical protein